MGTYNKRGRYNLRKNETDAKSERYSPIEFPSSKRYCKNLFNFISSNLITLIFFQKKRKDRSFQIRRNEKKFKQDDEGDFVEVHPVSGVNNDNDLIMPIEQTEVIRLEIQNGQLIAEENPENQIIEEQIQPEQIPENDDPDPSFESLFDEIFEVELPSVLWGVHRDVNRKFVAFSEFDASSMSSRKVLHIDHKLNCKIIISSMIFKEERYQEAISTEGVSKLLEELESLQIAEDVNK